MVIVFSEGSPPSEAHSPVCENFDKLTPSFVRIEGQNAFHCGSGAIYGSFCHILIVGLQESNCKVGQAVHWDGDRP